MQAIERITGSARMRTPMEGYARAEWSFAAAQARQTRAILWTIAIAFAIGPACLVFDQATLALARTVSRWLPAVAGEAAAAAMQMVDTCQSHPHVDRRHA
jgi:hypothetical protein